MAAPKSPKRPNYFQSQFLVVRDFQEEQTYHDEMLRRHNRLGHEWGVVRDGLQVSKAATGNDYVISTGSAIDKLGQEIVLDEPGNVSQDNVATARQAGTPGQDVSITIAFGEADSGDPDDKYPPKAGSGAPVTRKIQSPNIVATTSPATDGTVVILAVIKPNGMVDNSVRRLANGFIRVGQSNDLSIGADRFVGIGTTRPEEQLQIGSDYYKITLGATYGDGYGGRAQSLWDKTFGTAYLGFNTVRTNKGWRRDEAYGSRGASIIYNTTGGDLCFVTLDPKAGGEYVDAGDVVANKRLVINGSGNIHIAKDLSVAGGLSVTNQISALNGVQLNAKPLSLKSDGTSGLGYFGGGARDAVGDFAIDGPVLYGYSGGALGFWREKAADKKVVLSWNDSGNVGIGATNPEGQLQIGSGCNAIGMGPTPDTPGNFTLYNVDYGTAYMGFNAVRTAAGWRRRVDGGNNNGGSIIYNRIQGDLCFVTVETNSKEFLSDGEIRDRKRMVIGATGNVGIGTTTPATKLQVVGSGNGLPANTGASQSQGHVTRLKDSSNLVLDIGGAVEKGFWLQSTDIGDLSKNYPLLLNPNGGYVGIGSTEPQSPLHVKGNAGLLNLEGKDHCYIQFYPNAWSKEGRKGWLGYGVANDLNLTIKNETPNGHLILAAASGNVGIGTTTPATKLQVVGGGNGLPANTGASQSQGHVTRLKDSSNLVLDIGGAVEKGFWLQSTDIADLSKNYPLMLNPNGGNVGIGNADPRFKLSTRDSDTIAAGVLRLQNSYIGLNQDYSTRYGIELAGIDNGTNGHDLRIRGRTGPEAAFSDLVIVKNNGYMGIGTMKPAAPLDVSGRILRNGREFSFAGTAEHNGKLPVPWGTTDDWNIFLSPNLMGAEEQGQWEGDNAMLMILCSPVVDTPTQWRVNAQFKFRFANGPGEWRPGVVNFLLVPK